MTNCSNCGAVIVDHKCNYCGATFIDYTDITPTGDKPVYIKIQGHIFVCRCRDLSIRFEPQSYTEIEANFIALEKL